MNLMLTRADIERIYMKYGQTKLRTDVYDLSNVIFNYFQEKLKEMKSEFDFAHQHPGMVTCFGSSLDKILSGEHTAEDVEFAEISLYPIIDKPTLAKPIPAEMNIIDQNKSQ